LGHHGRFLQLGDSRLGAFDSQPRARHLDHTDIRIRQHPLDTRNRLLAQGIRSLSRSAHYSKSGQWAKKAAAWKKVAKKPAAAPDKKEKAFGKKGEKRVILRKTPGYYPAEDVHRPLPNNKPKRVVSSLRKTITPGTVLILLAGRFRGRRVVFLRQLHSGLLLVTGPFDINGVPARRVNQAYVIATSTKVDISKVNVPAKFDDKYFARAKKESVKQPAAAAAAAPAAAKKKADPQRAKNQEELDAAIVAAVKQVPQLARYLKAKFTLRNGQNPHELKF